MSFCTSLSLIYQRKTFQTYIVWRSNLIINTSIITTSKSNLTITIMVYPNQKNWKLKTCHFLQVNNNFDNDNFLRINFHLADVKHVPKPAVTSQQQLYQLHNESNWHLQPKRVSRRLKIQISPPPSLAPELSSIQPIYELRLRADAEREAE